jgi:predicted phosphate transport protein (TIGR00153 family)
MKLDQVIRWFMPREERFHELLGRDTQHLLGSARLFQEIARSDSLEERRVKAVQLKAFEHEGDELTRQIFEALNASFLTPFDREDIRSLAKDLDDILDYLEGVAQALVLFELAESPEALKQFAAILASMTEEIDQATGMVWDLANAKRIQAALVRISELENQGDRLYAAVIADLFKGEGRRTLDILKWKEVYDSLENACDLCKNYSNVLGNVVLKNA